MAKKEVIDVCRICQQKRKMTFEHVPPRKALNASKVKMVGLENILNSKGELDQEDYRNVYGKILQQGKGGYFLCSDCNSKTGQWYATEYVRMANGIASILSSAKDKKYNVVHLKVEQFNPLAFFKEVIVLFCDINAGLMGDESLKEFILNKESNDIDCNRYQLYMYLNSGKVERQNGIMVKWENGMIIKMTEISSYPMGFALYIDKPEGYLPRGVNITDFAKCNYRNNYSLEMTIPRLECNTIFSGDYRTELEIKEQVEKTNTQMKELLDKKEE